MGSFNTACAVTNVSMADGKVAIIPSIRMDEKMKHFENNPYFFDYSCGPFEYFCPILLPIFGTIGDYAEISEIERDENVEFLEKRFKMSIESVVQSMDKTEYDEKSLEISPGFKLVPIVVHRMAYDFMSKHSFDECDGKSDWSLWDSYLWYGISRESLAHLNFKMKSDSEWISQEDPTVSYIFEGEGRCQRGHFFINGKKIQSSSNTLKSFASILSKKSNISINLWKQYAESSPAIKESLLIDVGFGWIASLLREYDGYICERTLSRTGQFMIDCYQRDCDVDSTNKILSSKLDSYWNIKMKEGFFLDSLCSLQSFFHFLRDCNKSLILPSCGPQFGNKFAEKQMFSLCERVRKECNK